MHSSLRARTAAFAVLLALVVAVVFTVVSMMLVRNTLLDQVSNQARSDFSNQVVQAQYSLESADASENERYQQLVASVASSMQQDGAANLVGVYLWSRSTSGNAIVPISTEPTFAPLISDEMRSSVAGSTDGSVFYQPVSLTVDADTAGPPGAVLGTILEFGPVGDLELFALFSFATQQESLGRIQLNLAFVCLALSAVMGVLVWMVMHSIVRPIKRVAATAETLASGDLDARVVEDRRDEIGTLQHSFNEMASSLKQKIDELEDIGVRQRQFVSDVSHELRTPITTMRMACDLLDTRRDGFDPPTRRTVELLSDQVGRFQTMLIDLLEISRYDAGYASLDLVDTDVREPIGMAVEQVAEIAAAMQVTISMVLPNVAVIVRLDSRRVIRIVRNLLNNAIDFSSDDRPIEVRLAANRHAVVISVRDYGVGMTDEQVGHVFDRFWRADPSRSRLTGGSGLGLSIALSDAWLHNGDLRVRSRPGEGTWFLLILPRDPKDGPVPDADLPMDFAGDGMRTVGGFGVSDNGMFELMRQEAR